MADNNLLIDGWEDDEYKAFVEKFKAKKTTDDCYTPEPVYNAVADWVVNEYGVDRGGFVRPFWPGGDYERETYPDGCTVVDNPPFSILSQIVRFYTHTHGSFCLLPRSRFLEADSQECGIFRAASLLLTQTVRKSQRVL